MAGRKWYQSSGDLKEEALNQISLILPELNTKQLAPLKRVLQQYHTTLSTSKEATPTILSRMAMDISSCLDDYQLSLSDEVSDQLKELLSINNLRFGY